jgi:apolipoprotein N-acyltransferase
VIFSSEVILVIRSLLIFVCLSAAAQVFTFDWLSCDGVYSNVVAMSVFIFVSTSLGPKLALVFGYLFGLQALSGSFFWAERMLVYSLNQEGTIPKLVFWGLIAFESIPVGILAYLIAKERMKIVAQSLPSTGLVVPFAFWIAVEAWWPRVFSWTLGHSVQGWPAIIQIVDIGGASLVSWAMLWASALPRMVWNLISSHSQKETYSIYANQRGIVLTLVAIVATLTYGHWQKHQWTVGLKDAASYRLGVVQEDPSFVDSIPKMRAATDRLTSNVNLIVWPESTLGTLSIDLDSVADSSTVQASSLPPFSDLSPTVGLVAPLIAGGRTFHGQPREDTPQFQSAIVLASDGAVVARYHKQRLMPLGEFVPGEWRWPWLHDWFQLNEYILPGTDPHPVVMPDKTAVGILVCFEDIVPSVARKSVELGAELLVCIINASAFEDPIAIEQHLLLARLRAIENRRYFVRSSGTGVSCVVSPIGTIDYRSPINEPDAFTANVQRIKTRTVYSYLGNWVPYANIVIAGLIVFQRRSKSKTS